MEINTSYHGIKHYEEKDIISFPKGLPGFEKFKNFILFPVDENDIFSILQSIDDPYVGLTVISPFLVSKEYEFELRDDKMQELKLSNVEDLIILVTVTLSSNKENITVNLKAPIIININERIGEQIILDNEKYLIKHPLFKE